MVSILYNKGRTIRKIMGGGIFEPQGFFWLPNSLYEFFLGHSMNIFLGLIGLHEFFPFNFPLREYFFGASAALPLPAYKFSNGPSLTLRVSFMTRKTDNRPLASFFLQGKAILCLLVIPPSPPPTTNTTKHASSTSKCYMT